MIAMQETGVEAAAATAVILDASVAPETIPMTVNRPFVLAIVDGPTGAVLFLGHVEESVGRRQPVARPRSVHPAVQLQRARR